MYLLCNFLIFVKRNIQVSTNLQNVYLCIVWTTKLCFYIHDPMVNFFQMQPLFYKLLQWVLSNFTLYHTSYYDNISTSIWYLMWVMCRYHVHRVYYYYFINVLPVWINTCILGPNTLNALYNLTFHLTGHWWLFLFSG